MKSEIVTNENPKSPIAELFRTLRTNIQFRNSKNVLKTILVTSARPGEGKSWVSSNLAVTFAQTGKKVLLIDADMRKGRLHELFQVNKVPGFSNFLSGVYESEEDDEKDIIKIISETRIKNLYVIPSGSVPPNPSELLSSELTEELIRKLKELFDIIIFDGTPSFLVTDAVILSRLVDTTIIVSSYKKTKKEELIKVKKDIENVGGKIAGVLINKIPISTSKYESTYYYGSKGKK